jgi:hypothetical protein
VRTEKQGQLWRFSPGGPRRDSFGWICELRDADSVFTSRISDGEYGVPVRETSTRDTRVGVAVCERYGQHDGKARKTGTASLETDMPDLPDMQW